MVQFRGPVKTKSTLSGKSFIADKVQKQLRKPDTYGVVVSYPQQSNTVLVQHPEDPSPAIYALEEVEDTEGWWRVEHSIGTRIFFKEFDSLEDVDTYLESNGVSKKDVVISAPVFGIKEILEEGFLESKGFYDTLLDDEL